MIPRIKKLDVLQDYILFVEFDDGYKVKYDVEDDINTLTAEAWTTTAPLLAGTTTVSTTAFLFVASGTNFFNFTINN